MLIAVGSTNKTKIQAVEQVFSYHFNKVKVIGVPVTSGVSDQPESDEEMYQGALTRAQNALQKTAKAQYGVGIEGGIHKRSYGWFEHSLVVVIDKKGVIGIGASGGLALPKIVIYKIRKEKKTLEQAVDELFLTEKIGEGIGMFGLFTKGLVTRTQGTAHGVAFALARFLHQKLYP